MRKPAWLLASSVFWVKLSKKSWRLTIAGVGHGALISYIYIYLSMKS